MRRSKPKAQWVRTIPKRRNTRGKSLVPWTDTWSWALLADGVPEYLFEENPYIDRIDFDPHHVIVQRLASDEWEAEIERDTTVTSMGWEEYQRRQKLLGKLRHKRDRLMAHVSRVLAADGYSLRHIARGGVSETRVGSV